MKTIKIKTDYNEYHRADLSLPPGRVVADWRPLLLFLCCRSTCGFRCFRFFFPHIFGGKIVYILRFENKTRKILITMMENGRGHEARNGNSQQTRRLNIITLNCWFVVWNTTIVWSAPNRERFNKPYHVCQR